MMLAPGKLKFDANALSRSILTPHPDYADGAFAMHAALAEYQERTGQATTGVWVRTNTRGHAAYIEIRDEVSGQYCRDLPAGVDPAKVIDITLDPYLGGAAKMVSELRKLIASLAAGRFPAICGTQERVEIQNMPPAFWPEIDQQLARVQTAMARDYNSSVVEARSERIQPHLLEMIKQKDAAPVQQEMEDLRRAVSALRARYAADARLAAWAMYYCDLCQGILDHGKKLGKSDLEAAAMYVRYVAFCATPVGVSDPVGLTVGLADKTAREGLDDISTAIAERYFDEGSDLIDRALEMRCLDEFGDALYKAGSVLFAATRVYKALIEGNRSAVSESARALYAKRANVAEEHAVRVNTSLLTMVENRAGFRWIRHQARVREAQAGGPGAVEDEIIRLIEQNFFYPRCWARYLRGEPSALPPLECAA
jgi:hypothetical protein